MIEAILPGKIEITPVPWRISRTSNAPKDVKGEKIRTLSQPTNHSSRDRGIHPQISPTSRPRHGNKR